MATCSAVTKSGFPCKRIAYFTENDAVFCSSHSNPEKRKKLVTAPVVVELWKEAASLNAQSGRKGMLVCARLSYGSVSNQDVRFLRVFPNYKHQTRSDGFGCSSLSPMSLPVPNEATSLENYYQGSKKFPHESWSDYLENRNRMFLDPVPHRHKYQRGMKPECSYYLNKNGKIQAYDYLGARYFYCRWYEILTRRNEDLERLHTMRNQGVNLMLCGYDSSPDLTVENAWEKYHDLRTPFGHESVLFCLLTIENIADYPWTRFYREHPEMNYP